MRRPFVFEATFMELDHFMGDFTVQSARVRVDRVIRGAGLRVGDVVEFRYRHCNSSSLPQSLVGLQRIWFLRGEPPFDFHICDSQRAVAATPSNRADIESVFAHVRRTERRLQRYDRAARRALERYFGAPRRFAHPAHVRYCNARAYRCC